MCHKKRNDPNYSKNITDRATVNRATFYAHFNDKYEILDYSLSMTILKDIKEALSISETLNGQIISKLFVSIAYYLENVQNACKLNRETFCNHAHKCINNELEAILPLCYNINIPNTILVLLKIAQVFSRRFMRVGKTLVRYKRTKC